MEILKKFHDHLALVSALKKTHQPIHMIGRMEFDEFFAPNTQDENILSSSLSVLFTKYKTKQFLWTHEQFEDNGGKTKSQLCQEFADKHTPPWKLINEVFSSIRQHGGVKGVFNFKVTDPSEDVLKLDSYQNYVFSPQLTDRGNGQPRNFTELSSGEKTLLALAISIFQASESYQLRSLLLLDEIDASLHPSMAKALLATLQEVFVARGTPVILATHSPSTVALAPKESIHVVSKSDDSVMVSSATRGGAIQTLSEGFVALSNDALSMLDILQCDKLVVLTEGNNTKILKRLFQLKQIETVEVFVGSEDQMGDGDIKNYFSLFGRIGRPGKLLCVWDCDCDQHRSLKPSGNLFPYVIPHNPDNLLVKKGIENAFPEEAFANFKEERIPEDGSDPQVIFHTGKKKDFAEAMAQSKNVEWFDHFDGLIEKIGEITQTGLRNNSHPQNAAAVATVPV